MKKFIDDNFGFILIITGILAIAFGASIQWSLTGLLIGGGIASMIASWIWLDKH